MKAFSATWLALQYSGWSNPLAWALVIIALARVIAEPAINLSGWGTTYGAHELFQDGGVNHYLAWQLNSGKTLYEDIAYPYGPLPALLYAGFSAAVGNGQSCHALYQGILHLVFAVLLVLAVARLSAPLPAACALAIGLFLFGTQPYHPVERIIMAVILLAWEPPEKRGLRRAVMVGVLLGLWQWCKFGGAIYMAGALLAVDIFLLFSNRSGINPWRNWFLNTLQAAGIAAAFECARVVHAFTVLSPDVARDAVFPAFTFRHYQTMEADERYPVWLGWRYFLFRQAVPFMGCVAAVALAYRLALVPSQGDIRRRAGLLVPAAFFLLGIGTYMGHSYNRMMYQWALVPVIAGCMPARLSVGWLAVLMLALPSQWFWAKELMGVPKPDTVLPNGDRIAMGTGWLGAWQALENHRLNSTDLRPLLIVPVGAGYYFQAQTTPPMRCTWILPAYITDRDREQFKAKLDQFSGVALMPGQLGEPVEGQLRAIFGEELGNLMSRKIGVPREIGQGCVLALFQEEQVKIYSPAQTK